MVKQGVRGITHFMGWMLKGAAFDWECVEDDVAGLSCRAVLGEKL